MGMFDIPVPSKVNENISVPKKPEIGVDSYNSNLQSLKKSFKEYVDVLEDMKLGNTYRESEESVEDIQESYSNTVMFESYCDGPIFEKVDDENKEEIRAIAKKVRKELNQGYANSLDYYKGRTQIVNRSTDIIGMIFDTWIIDPAFITTFNNSELKLKSYQTVSYIIPSRKESIHKVLRKLNDQFKDDLMGKYEFDVVKMHIIGGVYTKKKELSDDEKKRSGNLKDLFFHPLLLIIKNKGTSASNKTEIEIQADKNTVSKLDKLKNAISSTYNKIKGKFSKKDDEKSDNTENKNESYELEDDFEEEVEFDNLEESIDDIDLDEEFTESKYIIDLEDDEE